MSYVLGEQPYLDHAPLRPPPRLQLPPARTPTAPSAHAGFSRFNRTPSHSPFLSQRPSRTPTAPSRHFPLTPLATLSSRAAVPTVWNIPPTPTDRSNDQVVRATPVYTPTVKRFPSYTLPIQNLPLQSNRLPMPGTTSVRQSLSPVILSARQNKESWTPAQSARERIQVYAGAKEILYARLNAKVLNKGRIVKEPASQEGAVCISPKTKQCYKIAKVLQSAIYGGVFEAEVYDIATVLHGAPGVKPRPRDTRVALKIMLRDLEVQHKHSLQEDINAEIRFKDAMGNHRNVVSYLDMWESTRKGIIFVVMPFAEFEDLFEVLRRRSVPFSEAEARWLYRQLIDAVRYLHLSHIGFRDHSLENVLMFRDGNNVIPKITDPGQAVKLRYDGNGKVLDLYAEKLFGKSFRPPEVYQPPKRYNPIKVDVFCIGWMLFFTVTKRQPFDRTLDSDPHWPLVRDGNWTELLKVKGNARLSPELIDLLRSMLHPDYRKRPDPGECLGHPWFRLPDVSVNALSLRGPATTTRRRPDPPPK